MAPAETPATQPSPDAAEEPLGEPVAAVQFQISTVDGGTLPPTARLCLEGQGIQICEPISTSTLAFAARPRISIVRTTDAGITVEVHDLLPGDYQIRLTGLKPYADITATLRFGEGGMTVQPIVLTHVKPLTAVPRPAKSDILAGAPAPSSAGGGSPADTALAIDRSATEVERLIVTGLPTTGGSPGASTSAPFALMMLVSGVLLAAAYKVHRNIRR